MRQNRLLELDALRGLGAVAVVLYHYFFRYSEIYGHPNLSVGWADYGKYGVQLFFIISGFVIYWTLNRVEKPMDFIVSRFARLYPVYWMALILTFALVSYFGLAGREVELSDAIKNLLMFHEYLGVQHVDGVYWTLTIELSFYLLVFVIYLLNQLRSVELWFTPLIFLSLARTAGFIAIPGLAAQLLIPEYIMFFVAGICFFKIYKNLSDRMTVPILLLSLVSTSFVFSVKDFWVFSVLYAVFYLAITGWLAFLRLRLFVGLGTVSYALYLVHQNIGYIIINQSYRWGLPPVFGILAAIATSLLIASVLTYYIERPSARMIRRAYKSQA
ncbi:O-acetyltransferase OatA [Acaryochloris thomasi RCC1774]|uniref:O-acetyltransferase OatA n=1 Tax=Acaryochloris thomasi RCC1774 TaxID=1764569 RepID=A0A2W1JQ40_9CYAN|nr:acyltransferase [Acaryochloris thomasi]PZD73012.1 O-acetyltransferase OatA [Acaryochloris thomasi RCC1774]